MNDDRKPADDGAPGNPQDTAKALKETAGEPEAAASATASALNAETDKLDLTPVPVPPRRSRKRRLYITLLSLAVAAGATFALLQLVSGASLFFWNVDEAVRKRSELEDRRFRMQGTPVAGSVTETRVDFKEAVAFTVAFGGIRADVVHEGSPPDLFAPGVPVVLEGRWRQGVPPDLEKFNCGANDGFYFTSDRLLIKHDNEYRDDYPERLVPADTGGC